MNSKYLLYTQLATILALFYLSSIAKVMEIGLLSIIFAAGVILSLWAFYNMGSNVFSPFPEPRKNGKIVQKGVYKYIRHPMYTGVALVTLALFITNANIVTFIIYALLLYILDAKAALEENLLTKIHPEYKSYMEKTKKFIPYLY